MSDIMSKGLPQEFKLDRYIELALKLIDLWDPIGADHLKGSLIS